MFLTILDHNSKSFTLIELLVVIAILAVLMSVVVVAINPAEMLKKTRDTSRISDLTTITKAISLYQTSNPDASLGVYQKVYVSLPANNTNCSDLNLPPLPTGYSYQCVTKDNLRKIDGTGWLPINFTNLDIGSPISNLPVDPNNKYNRDLNANNDFFYTYTISSDGQSYEINTKLESNYFGFTDRDGFPVKNAAKDNAPVNDGGDNGLYEKGTNLTLIPDSGGLCPSGMVWVPAPGRFCLDKYEASYATSGTKPDGTQCTSNCPISQYNLAPLSYWTSKLFGIPQVSQINAITYCQNMGKDLPTDFEWWLAAAGTSDPYIVAPPAGIEPCHIFNSGGSRKPDGSIWAQTNGWPSTSTAAINTGTAIKCKSIIGAMDMVGNVTEWTSNTVTCDSSQCTYQGIVIPVVSGGGGFITSIDNEGFPLTFSGTPSLVYNYDYYRSGSNSIFGFRRGGGWADGMLVGRFSLYVNSGANNASGFRCLLR